MIAYPRIHKRLLELPVYQEICESAFGGDIFHHISHSDYLRKGLTIKRRIEIAYNHYLFESDRWDDAYRRAVYSPEGLELWNETLAGDVFTIRLQLAKRTVPEGDLSVILAVNSLRVHRINFSWLVDRPESPVMFLGGVKSFPVEGAFELFKTQFPQQYPQYICFAAIQGIAEVAGISAVCGVRGGEQICVTSRDQSRFVRVYDDCWTSLGGLDGGGDGFLIPLPAHRKPLDDLTRSHRRRAKRRREQWDGISRAAVTALKPHFIPLSAESNHAMFPALLGSGATASTGELSRLTEDAPQSGP